MLLQIFDKIVSSPTLLVGTFLAISLTVGATKHWLINSSLRDRPQFDDKDFGKTFFSGSKRSEDIAVRVRRILSENLEMPFDGIRPEDKLDEDLNAQLEINPHLFWELEEEFGFDAVVEDLDVFQETTAGITTFSDLVKYVEVKIDELTTRGKRKRNEFEIDSDDHAGNLFATMWFGGLIAFFAGEIMGFEWLGALGLTIAFLPIAVGALYMCCKMIAEVVSIARNEGLQILLEHPWSTLFSAVIFSSLLWVGLWFTCGILSLWFGGT